MSLVLKIRLEGFVQVYFWDKTEKSIMFILKLDINVFNSNRNRINTYPFYPVLILVRISNGYFLLLTYLTWLKGKASVVRRLRAHGHSYNNIVPLLQTTLKTAIFCNIKLLNVALTTTTIITITTNTNTNTFDNYTNKVNE